MNLSRAKRRWKAWERYEARVIELCGGHAYCSPGARDSYNERAWWQNNAYHEPRKAKRWNRRTKRKNR